MRTPINQDLLLKRYAQPGETTWEQIAMRVAKHAGQNEKQVQDFYDLIHSCKFLPSRMAYMGTDFPFASSCFVFDIEDNLESIMTTLREACHVQKYGGGCIGGESMILTDHGPYRIKDFVEMRDPSIKVLSYNPETHRTEYRQVGEWHTTQLPGNRIYEISFGHNRATNDAKIRASDWHPFFVFDGEKVVEVRADELKPGMAVIGATEPGGEYNPYYWLLGYVTGDGSVDRIGQHRKQYGRVRIVDENKHAIERAALVLNAPYHKSSRPSYKSDVWTVESSGPTAGRVTDEYEFLPFSETKHVPSVVWEADADGRFSYLVGYLDADGWFCKEKGRYCAFTVSPRLADELLALAGSVGLRASKRLRKSRKANEQDGYEITFKRSQSLIDRVCAISTKYKKVQVGAINGSVYFSPAWKERLKQRGMKFDRQAWREKVTVNGQQVNLVNWLQNGMTTRENASAILEACGESLLAHAVRGSSVVKSVRCTGVDETLYDLTVPGTQTYIASDPTDGSYVVVHNTGYDFSQLRPKGDLINSSKGEASGPVSFMKLYHNAMEVVNRAGKKHAAQMGILRCDHPDIFEFIHCKDAEGALWTFNISVAITDTFMSALEHDRDWPLVFEEKVYRTVKARDLWNEIVQHAWHNGDPGVIFIDTVNRLNCYPFPIRATNPCGEVPQPSHFACNLGSIELSRHVIGGDIDWNALEQTTRSATRFLDGSIEHAYFPIEKIRQNTVTYRNVGAGVMGWADALIMLGIPYDSADAVDLAELVMKFVNDVAAGESKLLGNGSRKNVTLTAIAPTGSISMLADCSSGIEPLFGIVTTKNTYVGSYHNTHWLFEQIAKERGFYSEQLIAEIAKSGSVQHVDTVPDDVKRLFKTTNEIGWEWHVQHQAAFQKHTEQSVSKTINLPNAATTDDVSEAYWMAYLADCKSITIYRDGSRQVQVMDSKQQQRETCPNCQAILFMDSGVMKCVSCGYIPDKSAEIKPQKLQRPPLLNGATHKKETPIGTAYLTVNSGADGQPFEAFLNVGKAGSEVAAISEAMGRLISLVLRVPSPVAQRERLAWIADELLGIGGGRPLGFGPNRVRSLPDGVAQVLLEHLTGPSPYVAVLDAQDLNFRPIKAIGDICPECGEATFLNVEGCRKCAACGYSEC